MRPNAFRSVTAAACAAGLTVVTAGCARVGEQVKVEGACAGIGVLDGLADYRARNITVADVTVGATVSSTRQDDDGGPMVYTEVRVDAVRTVSGPALHTATLWVRGGSSGGVTVDIGDQAGPGAGQRAYVAVVDRPGLGPLILDTFPVSGDEVLLQTAACHLPGPLTGQPGSTRVSQLRGGSSQMLTLAGTLVPSGVFERAVEG